MGKNNLQHLYLPTRKWCVNWDNIRRYHYIIWEKIPTRIWYSYLNENFSHWAPQGIVLCTRKSSQWPWEFLSVTVSPSPVIKCCKHFWVQRKFSDFQNDRKSPWRPVLCVGSKLKCLQLMSLEGKFYQDLYFLKN